MMITFRLENIQTVYCVCIGIWIHNGFNAIDGSSDLKSDINEYTTVSIDITNLIGFSLNRLLLLLLLDFENVSTHNE